MPGKRRKKPNGLKSSRYNHFVKAERDKFLLYNAFSGGYWVVGEQLFSTIRKIWDGDGGAFEKHEELVKKLREDNFLVEDGFDEIGEVKRHIHREMHANDSLCVVISPSLDCNLACKYCFENGYKKRGRMSRKVADSVFKFIQGRLKGKRTLSVTWFGGEPLLCVDIIEALSGQFAQMCERRGVEYHSGVTTNGTLLTRDVAQRLVKAKVSHACITLDGLKETHDRYRPYKNGRGTFGRIIDNISAIKDLIDVIVSVNIDRKNMKSSEKLMGYLKGRGLSEDIEVTFNALGYGWRAGLDHGEHSRAMCSMSHEAIKCGHDLIDVLPSKGDYNCRGMLDDYFVIDPYGNYYKCLSAVANKEDRVGNVAEDIGETSMSKLWKSYDPFRFKQCRECDILPLCVRLPCPKNNLGRDLKKPNCPTIKHFIKGFLLIMEKDSCLRDESVGG